MIDSTETPEEQPHANRTEHPDPPANIVNPTPVRIDLYDVHTVRREMCALYRDMRRGFIKTQDGTRMAYVLDIIRKTYETCLLQDRLEALEQLLSTRKEKRHERR